MKTQAVYRLPHIQNPVICYLQQIQLNTEKNNVQALWYFTSLAKYAVVNNLIYQSMPAYFLSVFRINVKRRAIL